MSDVFPVVMGVMKHNKADGMESGRRGYVLGEIIREDLWGGAFELSSFYHNYGHKNDPEERPQGAHSLAGNRQAGLFLTVQGQVWLI